MSGVMASKVKDITIANCPKCGNGMIELEQDFPNMTEGQQADYDAGFNRPHECQECGYEGLFDVESIYETEDMGWEDPEVDELVEIIRIDPNSFEEVIEHALRSKCFIEAISLLHNTIEASLKKKIEDLAIQDKERLNLLKKKFKLKYLRDYNTIAYLLGLIDNELYKSILNFNEKRNKVIHELLINPKEMIQIKRIARAGKKLQMKLSPLNYSETDIQTIMDNFDNITQ